MKSKEQAALGVLHNTGIDILEAALVAKAALKAAHGRVKRALKCIAAGENALKQQERTVSFEKAVAAALEARKDRRTRTLYDFRYFTRRFMKRCPGLARRKVRSITPQECAAFIETAFDTPRHSKTGGARRVTIHKPLMRILRTHRRSDDEKISPANWPYHWRELRRASGWASPARRWSQDALRHTFASYHLRHFRSYAELQLEIGHRDASLLRTRYGESETQVVSGNSPNAVRISSRRKP